MTPINDCPCLAGESQQKNSKWVKDRGFAPVILFRNRELVSLRIRVRMSPATFSCCDRLEAETDWWATCGTSGVGLVSPGFDEDSPISKPTSFRDRV